jgi:hypothetical protein
MYTIRAYKQKEAEAPGTKRCLKSFKVNLEVFIPLDLQIALAPH